jgi:hypothetical protein
MVFDFYSKKIKVYVSEVSEDMAYLKEHLIKVLSRAGMEVLYQKVNILNSDINSGEEKKDLLYAADCSIHIIGKESIYSNENSEVSDIELELNNARDRIKSEWRDFRIFIWYPFDILSDDESKDQDNFISKIRQGIVQNMIFSNRESVVSFVEDIRSVMYGGKPVEFDIEKTELFFIYNALDYETANEIIYLVSDIIELKKLEIVLSADIDYAELVSQQIKKSKMGVIYYKNTSDWAVPFVQQVWKKVGGASSGTPILFIGDANTELNEGINFEAPKVISLTVAHEIIPIEIKVQYDSIDQ